MKNLFKTPLFFLFFLTALQFHAQECSHHDKKENFKKDRLDRMKEDLNLSDSQTADIKNIFDDFNKKRKKLHADKKAKIEAVLNPDQTAKFQKICKNKNKKCDKKKHKQKKK